MPTEQQPGNTPVPARSLTKRTSEAVSRTVGTMMNPEASDGTRLVALTKVVGLTGGGAAATIIGGDAAVHTVGPAIAAVAGTAMASDPAAVIAGIVAVGGAGIASGIARGVEAHDRGIDDKRHRGYVASNLRGNRKVYRTVGASSVVVAGVAGGVGLGLDVAHAAAAAAAAGEVASAAAVVGVVGLATGHYWARRLERHPVGGVS